MLNSNCIPRAFITRLKLYCNPAHWNFQWKGTQSGTQWIQYSDINLFILISKNHAGCLYLYLYLSLSYFVVLISTLFFKICIKNAHFFKRFWSFPIDTTNTKWIWACQGDQEMSLIPLICSDPFNIRGIDGKLQKSVKLLIKLACWRFFSDWYL